MKLSGLQFDDLPPLEIPLRFYLTAPVFGLVAALFLLWEGPDTWMSRWTSGSLGATHLLTLGFMTMAMVGALFQLLPVLADKRIPSPKTLAPIVHVALVGGVIALTAALVRSDPVAFYLAIASFAFAFSTFLLSLGWRLARIRRGGDSVFAIRLAAFSLLATVGMGVFLAVGRAVPELGLPVRSWTDVHVLWGLFGWVPLLVMGISYQVIPILHIAPAFESRLARGIPLVVFTSLLLLSHARSSYYVTPIITFLCLSLVTYCVTTLRILSKRRRRRHDPMVGFWLIALCSLTLSSVLLWFSMATSLRIDFLPEGRGALLIGTLMVLGFACSVIIGLLQKTVPVLIFLHLRQRSLGRPASGMRIPITNRLITHRDARRQLHLHAAGCVAISAALVWPVMGRGAALLLALDFGWLLRNLILATRRYRRACEANPPEVSV